MTNSTTTCQYSANASGTIESSECSTAYPSSSQIATVAGFSYGEAIAALFLGSIFMLLFYGMLWDWVHGIKIRIK